MDELTQISKDVTEIKTSLNFFIDEQKDQKERIKSLEKKWYTSTSAVLLIIGGWIKAKLGV